MVRSTSTAPRRWSRSMRTASAKDSSSVPVSGRARSRFMGRECSRESGRVARMNTNPLTLAADDVVYAIDKDVPPRLRLTAPAEVTIATLDARAGRLTRPEEVESTAPDYRDRFPRANPATGPIYVEGRRAGRRAHRRDRADRTRRARLHAGQAGLRRDPRRGGAAGGALRRGEGRRDRLRRGAPAAPADDRRHRHRARRRAGRHGLCRPARRQPRLQPDRRGRDGAPAGAGRRARCSTSATSTP